MRAIKQSIAYVIYNNDKSKVLIVKRPKEDDDDPDFWGLPAGSLYENEDDNDAIIRSGRDKLGVLLSTARHIGIAEKQREKYHITLNLYEAHILSGIPSIQQDIPGITQYTQWKWGVPNDLKAVASHGSLCCKIYLESIGESFSSHSY